MIIIRQKLYSLGFTKAIAGFNKNILGKSSIQSARSSINAQNSTLNTIAKIKTPIDKQIANIKAVTKETTYNPGGLVNEAIEGAIRNPAKTVTNLVVDQGLGAVAGNFTGGLTNVLPVIPGSGKIGNSLGGKIQNILDGGKKAPALKRGIKAGEYMRSDLAKKVEYGVNNAALTAGNFGSILSSVF